MRVTALVPVLSRPNLPETTLVFDLGTKTKAQGSCSNALGFVALPKLSFTYTSQVPSGLATERAKLPSFLAWFTINTPALVEPMPNARKSTRERPLLIPLKWVPRTKPGEPVKRLFVKPLDAVALRAQPASQFV